MSGLEKIVVGHDLQAGGEIAARSAAELARRCGAHVKLVHVVESYPIYSRLSHPFTPPYSTEELAQRAGEKLQTLATNAEYGFVRVEYEVRTGKPFVELILVRRAWQADLIVVGCRTEGQERFLGSTGERVLRKAMVPVLVAKKPIEAGPKTFLVPTDFSLSAKKAAEEALTLVGHFGGRILFLHALEPPSVSAVGYGPDVGIPPPVPLISPEDLKSEWQAFLSDLPSLQDIAWNQHTIEGHAVTTITKAAEEYQVDMIVMGTHGRTGLSHMLLGSVAEGVVRRASCSVLTIRPEAFQFDLP